MALANQPLFRRDLEPRCAYCARGTKLDDRTALCKKCGVVDLAYHCRSFQYDPFKRVPPKKPVLRGGFSQKDFSLTD
jgi:hypothetical protein